MTEDATHDTAGAGSPAPAVLSPDLLDPRARVELERLARRWGELSLARAQGRMPLLRAALATLARLTPHPTPRLIAPQPRSGATSGPLGAVVIDQLAVLVWDAYAASRGDGIPDLLTDLRRELG